MSRKPDLADLKQVPRMKAKTNQVVIKQLDYASDGQFIADSDCSGKSQNNLEAANLRTPSLDI